MNAKKRKWHVWVQNIETGETRCKICEAHNFGRVGWAAFQLTGDLRVKTQQIWDIMSISDINFKHDPRRPIGQ